MEKYWKSTKVISAEELKKLAKMVELDKFAFSNIAQGILANWETFKDIHLWIG